MARKPGNDERQDDFFGAPVPAEPKRPASAPGATSRPARRRPPPVDAEPDPDERPAPGLALLSPAELREMCAALPDEALGRLVLAAVRQLRRRLEREGHGGTRVPLLHQAVQEVVAAFAEPDEEDF